jgi:hypothetical protein
MMKPRGHQAAEIGLIALAPQAQRKSIYLRLKLDFQSEASRKLFHTWGTLMLWSDTSFPYVVLSATLCNEDLWVNKAKHMLIKVGPVKKYGLDISKNL